MPERFVITSELGGERLDKVLVRLLPSVSRTSIQRWISEQRVLRNGEPCRARDILATGDLVTVARGPSPPTRALPDPSVEVDIVYEDSELCVVNKPAGLVVHPGRGHAMGTLVNGLLARVAFGTPPSDPLDPEGAMRPGIVHRIDKETSGLLVVAKTISAREGLKRQLAAHSMQRVYRAITLGTPRAGRIQTLHGRHPRSRLKFTSRTQQGREAITHVELLESLAHGACALVECRLETGRTHQIRVHLAEQLGCPILCDSLYGRPPQSEPVRSVADQLGRQALHAGVLGFVHPRTGEQLLFEAPLPDDLQQALAALRADGPP